MAREPTGEIIELTAVDPDGDLACDITIATTRRAAACREGLRECMRPPVRDLPDGVERALRAGGLGAVQRYVDIRVAVLLVPHAPRRAAADAVMLR